MIEPGSRVSEKAPGSAPPATSASARRGRASGRSTAKVGSEGVRGSRSRTPAGVGKRALVDLEQLVRLFSPARLLTEEYIRRVDATYDVLSRRFLRA